MTITDTQTYIDSLNAFLATRQLPLRAMDLNLTHAGSLPVKLCSRHCLWCIRPPRRQAQVTFSPLNSHINLDKYKNIVQSLLADWLPVAAPEWTGIDDCTATFDKTIVEPVKVALPYENPSYFALFKVSQSGPLPLYPPRSLQVIDDNLDAVMINVSAVTGSDWKQEKSPNGITLSPGGPTSHCLLYQRRANRPLQVASSTVPVRIHSSRIWNGLSILRFARNVQPDDKIVITSERAPCPDIVSNVHIFTDSNRSIPTRSHSWTVVGPHGSRSIARRLSLKHRVVDAGLPVTGGHAGAIKSLLREILGQAPLSIQRLACLYATRFIWAIELTWPEDTDTRQLRQAATKLLVNTLPSLNIYHTTAKENTR